jgi:CheY-like chemotaxis protein
MKNRITKIALINKDRPMKTILIIDSDVITSALTAKFLSNYGHNVYAAHDGKEGLDRMGKQRFDLVLSEVELNGLSGFDTLKLMRKCYTDVPFAFLTSDDDRATRAEAEMMGAMALISKRQEYINLPFILEKFFYPSHDLVA